MSLGSSFLPPVGMTTSVSPAFTCVSAQARRYWPKKKTRNVIRPKAKRPQKSLWRNIMFSAVRAMGQGLWPAPRNSPRQAR